MAHEDRAFERIASETIFDGRIIAVTNDTFRYGDGKTAEREIVRTSGAAAIVAVDDDDRIWLVRQPREPVEDPDSLELPAGRLDPGEDPLVSAQRELAEEIGMVAARWTPLKAYRS